MQFLDENTAKYRFKNYPNRPFWLADLSMDRPYMPMREKDTFFWVMIGRYGKICAEISGIATISP